MAADFRRERERMADACEPFSFKTIPGCAIELFTDHPLHIAAGSMPPQNGFAAGVAFVTAKNTTNWRFSSDIDAVGANTGSWRAGGYLKFVHTPAKKIDVISAAPSNTASATKKKRAGSALVYPATILNLYAQSISLNRVNFFGIGNDSQLTGASAFGMSQTILGGSAIKPIFEWPAIAKLNLALIGEINERIVDIRGNRSTSASSIETVYTSATAPGLDAQPAFIQSGEGIRIKPVLGDRLQFNYSAKLQQFLAPSATQYSFQRWTMDLNHTLYLYGYTHSAPRNPDPNGPDECAPGDQKCPAPSYTPNRDGALSARLMISESVTSATSVVPFYFQPTLGGSDLDGMLALASYQDYRYRAPNILLLQETFEHSVWGPFGLKLMADEGRVATTRGELDFNHLRHSFAGGLTLRAGGFPMASLMFAWGGREGHHNIFNMDTSLLGGSSRPSLF
jgi:hypothetical protein